MSDLGTMVRRVREDLNRGTDYDARIKEAIEDAIAYYAGRRFYFNTKRAVAEISLSAEFITLPTDFVEVDYIRLKDDTALDPLAEVTYRWIEENRRSTNYVSTPNKYAIQNDELRLYPVSDGNYTLTISYIYELGDVSKSATDTATNAWMTDGEQLIRMHAMADILQFRIRGPEAIQEANAIRSGPVRGYYNTLKRRSNRQESTGRLMPWA